MLQVWKSLESRNLSTVIVRIEKKLNKSFIFRKLILLCISDFYVPILFLFRE